MLEFFFFFFTKGAKRIGQLPTVTASWNSTKTRCYRSPNNCYDYSIGRDIFRLDFKEAETAEVIGYLQDEKAMAGYLPGTFCFLLLLTSSQSSLSLPLKEQFIQTTFLHVTYFRTFSCSTPALKRPAALVKTWVVHFAWWVNATPEIQAELGGSVIKIALGVVEGTRKIY